MRKYLFLALISFTLLASCSKVKQVDPSVQAGIDEALITSFIAKNNLTAVRHSSGLYYVIQTPGAGSLTYTANTNITAKYTGRLLDGTRFDSNAAGIPFKLGGVILGWQIGIPFIQKGGKIRLLIPSALGYGASAVGNGAIPANSVLDFDIELVDASN